MAVDAIGGCGCSNGLCAVAGWCAEGKPPLLPSCPRPVPVAQPLTPLIYISTPSVACLPSPPADSARHRFQLCRQDLQQQLDAARAAEAAPAELAPLQCRCGWGWSGLCSADWCS